jgi:carbon-monoxide dehydrogenase medium subunit
MKDFDYVAPSTLKETLELLDRSREQAKIMSGGTDLVPLLKSDQTSPQLIIDVGKLTELDYITEVDGGLRIGALTTHATIERSELVRKKARSLAEAAHEVGTAQIRNVGTIGGNLCNASPAADTAPPLLAMNAAIRVAGAQTDRTVPLREFFVGVKKTVLGNHEMVTEVLIPGEWSGTKQAFVKLGKRNANALSVASAAVALRFEKNICTKAGMALGSVGPTALIAAKAQEVLRGHKIDESILDKVCETAKQEANPITDMRGTAEYRREMSGVLLRKAVRLAASRLDQGND